MKQFYTNTLPKSILNDFPAETVYYSEDTSYIVSSDIKSNAIQEYFLLREKSYQKEGSAKLKGLLGQGKVDHHDSISDFVIAKKDDEVIGGARLTIKKKGEKTRLPLEGTDFSLIDSFPELDLENKSYAEPGRFIIKKEYRHGKNYGVYHTNISKLSIAHAVEIGCDYLFAVAPATQAKLYQITYRRYGVNTIICNHINLPEKSTDEKRKMILLAIDLNKVSK